MLFQEEQLQQYKKDLFLKEQLTKQTVKTLFWKEQLKHSRRLLAEKNAIQTERALPGGEDLRCRTWKKRGLYRPVSLICGSKCTNQKRAPKAPFFCPFWRYFFMLHRVVNHWPKNQSANFDLYGVKRKEDIDLKQRQLRKRPKQGKKPRFPR